MKSLMGILFFCFLLQSCICEDDPVEPKIGKITLNLIESDLKNSGNKQEVSELRTEAVDEAYRNCAEEEISAIYYGPEAGLYYVAELVDNGKSIGHRMCIANPFEEELYNVKVTSAIYGEIFAKDNIGYPYKIWFTVPEACDGLTLTFESYATMDQYQTKTKMNGVKLEVCDYKALECEFPEIMHSLDQIDAAFNLQYYVNFYQNDQLMYSFEYYPPGAKTYEIAFGTYDIFIKSINNKYLTEPDVKGDKISVQIKSGTQTNIELLNKSPIIITSALNLRYVLPREEDWIPNWLSVKGEENSRFEYYESYANEGSFPPLYLLENSNSATVSLKPWDYPERFEYSINDPVANKIYKIMLCGIAKPEFKV